MIRRFTMVGRRVLASLVGFIVMAASGAGAAILVPSDSTPEFTAYPLSQECTLFLPQGVDRLRGLYAQFDSNIPYTNPPEHYEACLCLMWQFGFLRLGYGNVDETRDYKALLKEAATKSGHPELEFAPFVGYGGRGFHGRMTTQLPDQCLAYLHYMHGGVAGNVPRMTCDYETGSGGFYDNAAHIASDNTGARGRGEPVIYAPLWGWPRGFWGGREVLYPLFDWAVRNRLPSGGPPANGKVTLKPFGEVSDCWTGDPATWFAEWPEIYECSEYPKPQSQGPWIPTEALAYVWKGFVGRDPVLENRLNTMFGIMMNQQYGNTFGASSPQRIGVVSPIRHHDNKGIEAPLVEKGTILRLQIQSTYQEEGIEEIRVFENSRLFATPKPNSYFLWMVPCTLSTPGVRSIVIHARLGTGKWVSSRPAMVFVADQGSSTVVAQGEARLTGSRSTHGTVAGRMTTPLRAVVGYRRGDLVLVGRTQRERLPTGSAVFDIRGRKQPRSAAFKRQ